MRLFWVTAATALGLLAAADAPIAYPEGFRAWTHVLTDLAGPASPAAPKYEGFHSIYANPKARAGYTSGKWPDGAVIVFDVLNASHGAGDATTAGQRKFIDVMVRDSRRYAATGGWGYTEFTWPDKARVAQIEANPQGCDGCHQKNASGGDRVFSELKD